MKSLSVKTPLKSRLAWVAALAVLLSGFLYPSTTASAAPARDGGTSYVSSTTEMAALFSTPATADLSPRERENLAERIHHIGQALRLAAQSNPGSTPSTGTEASPDFWISLGWRIYVHDITPKDQRFFLQAGVGVVAAAICAASAGTACAVAGIIAAVLVAAIAEYYEPRCNLYAEFYNSGQLRTIYPTKCW